MSRVYFYSHDGQGLGHLRRNLNIASAVSRKVRSTSCMLLTGAQFPSIFRLPARCDLVKFPALRKTRADAYLPLSSFENAEQVSAMRAAIIEAAISAMPPDLLIVDRHAGGLNGELLPALRYLRKSAPGCRIVLGLRDVLDEPAVVANEFENSDVPEIVDRYYHRVWIYGDSHVFDTARVYRFPESMRRKTAYCGYLLPRDPTVRFTNGQKVHVVASVGGGADGYPVLDQTIAALELLQQDLPIAADVFAGPLMSKTDYESLRALAAPHKFIRVERFSQNYLRLLSTADLVITMGGYNSTVEAVSAGKRTIVIPRVVPRTEQLLRAKAFEALGLVSIVEPQRLTPDALLHAAENALSGPEPHPDGISFSGAADVVRRVRHIISTGTVSDT
jgi:predicted glycosyltransferase